MRSTACWRSVMLKEKEFAVYGDNGMKGTLLSAARFLDPNQERKVRLEDGRVLMVPANSLTAQPDGSYYFRPTNSDRERAAPFQEVRSPEPRTITEPESPQVSQAAISEPPTSQAEPRQVFAPSAAG